VIATVAKHGRSGKNGRIACNAISFNCSNALYVQRAFATRRAKMAEVEEKSQQETGHRHESVQIYLDGVLVTSPTRRLTGRQIRELGPADRVDGFETQEIDAHGKKIRTIGDNEEVELHEHERFRTVPNHGGPGAGV
jgi:hypothetical protein